MGQVRTANVLTDTAVVTGRGTYYGARASGDGATGIGAVIYDNTSAAGTILDQVRATATISLGEQFLHGVPFQTGLFVDIGTPAGTASVIVWYEADGA